MTTQGLLAGSVAATLSLSAMPTGAQERSLDEIKKEVMRRAGHINPFEGIRREDVEQIVAALASLDRDHWAAAWCKVGLAYEEKADARAKAGAPGKELAELYTLAFEYCHIARYPVPSSPGKEEAYRHSLRLFRKAAQHYAPPLAIIEIPFEGKTLVGYLQIPPDVVRPPVVMHWGGVDGWKENRQRPSAAFHRAGIATLTVDMPGTGDDKIQWLIRGGDKVLYRSPAAGESTTSQTLSAADLPVRTNPCTGEQTVDVKLDVTISREWRTRAYSKTDSYTWPGPAPTNPPYKRRRRRWRKGIA